MLMTAMLVGVSVGCASDRAAPPGVHSAHPWRFDGRDATLLQTPHFAIHTTLTDPRLLNDLARVLEAAYDAFVDLLPPVSTGSPRPLNAYVLADRSEWQRVTRALAGDQAEMYLRITRGGFTIGDTFAIYHLGRDLTLPLAAHEAWHAYLSRHALVRPPPAIEEGLATLFESVRVERGRVLFDPRRNPLRAGRVGSVLRSGRVRPVRELLAMHAGDVVGRGTGASDAFYVQTWALALLLTDPRTPARRDGLRRLLADCAAGRSDPPIALAWSRDGQWGADRAADVLEVYLGPLDALEADYEQLLRDLARRRMR